MIPNVYTEVCSLNSNKVSLGKCCLAILGNKNIFMQSNPRAWMTTGKRLI